MARCSITRFGLVVLAAGAAMAAVRAAAAEKPEPQPLSGKVEWVYDYEQGQRLGRESGKPMFVVIRCER